jgi:hypothetical protein
MTDFFLMFAHLNHYPSAYDAFMIMSAVSDIIIF